MSKGKKISSDERVVLIGNLKRIHDEMPGGNTLDIFKKALEATPLAVPINPSTSNASRYMRLAGLTEGAKNGDATLETRTPSQRIKDAEKEIQDALREIDNERHRKMQEVKELDDLAARHRHPRA